MKHLKAVHRHGSETFLLISKNPKNLDPTNIIKSSSTLNGINSIISECEGISWYNNRNKNKIRFQLDKKTKTYHRVQIEINKGFFNIDTNKSYLNLIKYLDLTIDHYIEIWQEYRNNIYAPFHGDLSLVGNIMFNKKNEVLFVDWEQFDNNFKMPIGLDLMMIIIENFWYEILRYRRVEKEVLKHIKNSVKKIYEAKFLSALLKDKPAQNSLNYINSNIEIWKGQHYKLPAFKIPKKYLIEIDNAIEN